ncbi:MAG: Fur family transcriptional regulator [Acidimicrobiales bacterium]
MSERKPSDPAELLRQHALQVTAQRLAVLRAVSCRPHGTADEIEELVRAEIGAVSRQAVYDALGILTDKGLIRRIQPARSPARYEDRVNDNHHHLVCRSCGATVDVYCAVDEAPCLEAADDHGFIVDEAEVIYWGTCPACQIRVGGSKVVLSNQCRPAGADWASGAVYCTAVQLRLPLVAFRALPPTSAGAPLSYRRRVPPISLCCQSGVGRG